MELEFITKPKKIKVINKKSSLVVISLWTDPDILKEKLLKIGCDISNIGLISPLFGNGMDLFLRNLKFNPQVDTILICGNDMSKSSKYINNFFSNKIEYTTSDIKYDIKNVKPIIIKDTCFIFDDMITPDEFDIKIIDCEYDIKLATYFINNYKSKEYNGERVVIDIPKVIIDYYPSNMRDHNVTSDSILNAYEKLVHICYRFASEVNIAKGRRKELQNVKVVINNPTISSDDKFKECGFDPELIRKYMIDILSPDLPTDTNYTYGNIIRGDVDCLRIVIDNLSNNTLDHRNNYISLWVNSENINGKHPCMVSLFFRMMEDRTIHVTCSFRTHQLSDAWVLNTMGVYSMLKFVSEKSDCKIGSITMFSHSISISPDSLAKMKPIHDMVSSRNEIEMDPNGQLLFTIDGDEIVVTHMNGSLKLDEYRSKNGIDMAHKLNRNHCMSNIGHSLYVGRMIERCERCIKTGEKFVEV